LLAPIIVIMSLLKCLPMYGPCVFALQGFYLSSFAG
jgi:hypothetical protein